MSGSFLEQERCIYGQKREKEHSASGRSPLAASKARRRNSEKGARVSVLVGRVQKNAGTLGVPLGAGRAGQRRRALVTRVMGRVVSTGQSILS